MDSTTSERTAARKERLDRGLPWRYRTARFTNKKREQSKNACRRYSGEDR